MKIWIFSLEPIESRYTQHWHTYIPNFLRTEFPGDNEIIQIDGDVISADTSTGAFLNFTNTNLWKSTQLAKFVQFVNEGFVGQNDHIIFTDAWNPCITQVKYMKELSLTNWTLHGLWHAGSYDNHDFLGRLTNKAWIRNLEKSMYACFDHNYFATEFHIDLFVTNLFGPWYDGEDAWMGDEYTKAGWIQQEKNNKKIVRSGFPFEYTTANIFPAHEKKDQIIFAHRLAPEKQLEIFKDLEKELPQYKFIVCQENELTKKEYHELLGESKIVFSASLQETLGISQNIEGPAAECLPLNPDRLSYSEIFANYPEFLYDSMWTKDWLSYTQNKEGIKAKINDMMVNHDWYTISLKKYLEEDAMDYFRADELINVLKEYSSK